ncbi:hypothetical protein GUJ93_ZPchr0009g773 [Zizania palustris]|uniref:Uncharacterized protein n=1 Tax=Zizania palustris TaxID=103762 RepID=A0A8J5V2S8_ZIZPA|nr:hypothetical protein GUJ93_ZPchr0009g773 [Zizania palustris]KAG8049127.1 hypothetical protein GUJ93_ZPchr0009g773 [Zizania palustris]
MAWRSAASRTVLASVRRPAPSAARGIRAPPPPPLAAPRRRVPSAFAPTSSPIAAARPLAAMMGSPLTTATLLARLTAHPAASVRACCELSQGESGKDG